MNYYSENKNSLLEYDKEFRTYRFLIKDGVNGTHQMFSFCPWCASKLPKELGDIWEETIQKELGYEDPFYEPGYDNLPKEFRTDEWWRKRGL